MSRFHGFVRNIAVTQGTKQRPTQQGTCGIMSVRVIVKLKLSVTRDGLKKNKIVGYNMTLLPRKLNRMVAVLSMEKLSFWQNLFTCIFILLIYLYSARAGWDGIGIQEN